jgi:hypothetical protein
MELTSLEKLGIAAVPASGASTETTVAMYYLALQEVTKRLVKMAENLRVKEAIVHATVLKTCQVTGAKLIRLAKVTKEGQNGIYGSVDSS